MGSKAPQNPPAEKPTGGVSATPPKKSAENPVILQLNPVSIPAATLSAYNQPAFDRAVRRLREMVVEGQQRQATGKIVYRAHMMDGKLAGRASVGNEWDEKQ